MANLFQVNSEKLMEFLVMFKGVSMNPFPIEIFHGRKGEKFVKAMIYCNHLKVEGILWYSFQIFVLLENAEKV